MFAGATLTLAELMRRSPGEGNLSGFGATGAGAAHGLIDHLPCEHDHPHVFVLTHRP